MAKESTAGAPQAADHDTRQPYDVAAAACVKLKAAAAAVAVLIATAAPAALPPPYDPRVINPDDDEQVAATLADLFIPLEVKEQLFLMWDARLWPQEIKDPRDGSIWVYRAGRPPVRE